MGSDTLTSVDTDTRPHLAWDADAACGDPIEDQLGISATKARALLRLERDGYRCAVPGCTSRRNLHGHRLRFRSAGGSDALDNRVTICAFHHQRCLHAGLTRIRGTVPAGLLFELGLRAGTSPLVRYRSGDIALPGDEPRPPMSSRRPA